MDSPINCLKTGAPDFKTMYQQLVILPVFREGPGL